MELLRLMNCVLSERGELGIMWPVEERVRGVEMRVPDMHWRQLINCVANDILK